MAKVENVEALGEVAGTLSVLTQLLASECPTAGGRPALCARPNLLANEFKHLAAMGRTDVNRLGGRASSPPHSSFANSLLA